MALSRRIAMSKIEEDTFNFTLDEILDKLTSYSDDMQIQMHLLKRALFYNVTGGKQMRGQGVLLALKSLSIINPQLEKECYILGWCIEIMQASLLIVNDIVQNSETRRGRICWYLKENVGDLAISDAIVLSGVVNLILDNYFSEKPYYLHLTELFHIVAFRANLGHCMDVNCSRNEKASSFTMDAYKKIVKYKTSCISFLLPISCAIMMSGNVNELDQVDVEKLALDIGFLYQVQDDFLDCYGDYNLTGKIGSNISENKCSWLIVKAYEKANDGQRKILKDNYGRNRASSKENERNIRSVFDALNIRQQFQEFEDSFYNSLCQGIKEFEGRIPTTIFIDMVNNIYRRKK